MDDDPLSRLYLSMGLCAGVLSTESNMVEFVDSLKDAQGVNPGYVMYLRDKLTQALHRSGHEFAPPTSEATMHM